ncbi:MAG: UDP-glucose dehydrogenase family protein [Chloroflexota bacterium]
MSNICVIGAGYVGLVTGACLADLGNRVYCLDCDQAKIRALRDGVIPIYEPGLTEVVRHNLRGGRLIFTTDYAEAIPEADIVFIAVGTPSGAVGQADLQYVEAAARGIAEHMARPTVIVNKSTVPIGTGDLVAFIVRQHVAAHVPFAVVSNPEFLREGSAVHDFMHPDRVVLGAVDREAAEKVADLYRPLNCPLLITDLRTAEMIKYASNAFLATKISFINEMAAICDQLGADVRQVADGMGLDRRIGRAFLDAGLGWGGSCFPKDVHALINTAANYGAHPQLLRAVVDINYDQRRQVVLKLRQALGGLRGKTIGMLGLAFKPNTDDMRDAASRDIITLLQGEGVNVKAYDPVAMENARRFLPAVEYCADPYELADGCDGLVLVTEWNEFKRLDMASVRARMRHPVLVDGRNLYDPQAMRDLGFDYRGIGCGTCVDETEPDAVAGV